MKTIYSLLILLVLASCQTANPAEEVPNPEPAQLVGSYNVDFSPIVDHVTEELNENENIAKIGEGLAGLFLDAVKLKIHFYPENKGKMEFEGGVFQFAVSISDEPLDSEQSFEYKLESDSILWLKEQKNDEFEKWAVLREPTKNYDTLKLMMINEGEENIFLNLYRIKSNKN
ncbi:hypothetical protein [Luteibaculum oceani]|uniref:Uncharacterized protein n=1 Tax=Luteibaculum oceani TaxID=1294296 RepID=A0A5C6VC14_9FLAO|nr:hypothetical protein [Luteibaculum oceani]TXC82086.1 hypothetical protein FRX97_03055 [Luteibaculum oceani]